MRIRGDPLNCRYVELFGWRTALNLARLHSKITVRSPRRIALVAGYDPKGLIHDYVVFLIRSLSEISDVYYYADGNIEKDEINKIIDFVKWYGIDKHGKYDFGSWKNIIDKLGWGAICEYDQLILVNDSVYGPIFDLKSLFEKMDRSEFDFWGITISKQIADHIQSYFMVFNNKSINSDVFKSFWNGIKVFQNDHIAYVRDHEIRLSRSMVKSGFSMGALVKVKNFDNPCFFPLSLISDFNSPFIKVKCYKDPKSNLFEDIHNLNNFIKNKTKYNINYVINHRNISSMSTEEEKYNNYLETVYLKIGYLTLYTTRKSKLKLLIGNKKIISIKIKKEIISYLYSIPYLRRRLCALSMI